LRGANINVVNSFVFLALFLAVQQTYAQPEVLYTDDFLTTPTGWTIWINPPSSPPLRISTLDFGLQGASFFMFHQPNFPSVSYIHMKNSAVAIVPSDIDHLNLYASQINYTTTSGAWALGVIHLLLNGSDVGSLFSTEYHPGGDPINVDIIPSEFGYMPGDTIGFHILSQVLSYEDSEDQSWFGILRWHITDFTLTAYDENALYHSTWGSIKTFWNVGFPLPTTRADVSENTVDWLN